MTLFNPTAKFKYNYNKFFNKIDTDYYRLNLSAIYDKECGFYNSLLHDVEVAKIYKKIEHDNNYVSDITSDIGGPTSNVKDHKFFSFQELFRASIVYRKIQFLRVVKMYNLYFDELKKHIDFYEEMVQSQEKDFSPEILDPRDGLGGNKIKKEEFYKIIKEKIDELISIDIMNPTCEIKMDDYKNITETISNQIKKVSAPGVNGLMTRFRVKEGKTPKTWLAPMQKHNIKELKKNLNVITDVFNLSYIINNSDNPKWLNRALGFIENPEREKKFYGHLKDEGSSFFCW